MGIVLVDCITIDWVVLAQSRGRSLAGVEVVEATSSNNTRTRQLQCAPSSGQGPMEDCGGCWSKSIVLKAWCPGRKAGSYLANSKSVE